MLCRELGIEEFFKANDFYRLTSYSRSISLEERVFIVESNGAIIAAVCIERNENVNVLRGMYVLPEMIGNKIGSMLLTFIEPFISELDTYCIPYKNLISFYGKIGFTAVSESEHIPEFLFNRFHSYFTKGLDVVIMRRGKI